MGSSKEEIGARIKQIRDGLSMTQLELGNLLGVGKSAVSAYEKGTNDTSPSVLVRVSEISGKSLDWLITGKEPEPQTELQPAPTTYPLGEEEKTAVITAENLLKYSGLGKRFAVVEIHPPPSKEGNLSEEEERLLNAFRSLDRKIQEALLIQAEMTAEGLKKSARKEPQGGGLMEAI